MLSQAQFIERINELLDEEQKGYALDEALKRYAEDKEFTGFSNSRTVNSMLERLTEDMHDSNGYISWWLWDCPERGENKECCKIWLGDSDDPNTEVIVVDTAEKLYDFLVTQNPGIDDISVQLTAKAQDTGVAFALKIINDLKQKNFETRNEGWSERDAQFEYLMSKIDTEYRLTRGAGANLNFENLRVMSVLDEES